jgi:HEAT repeat protein
MRALCLSLLLLVWGCTHPEKDVPVLIKQLQSSDAHTRSQAALRLGRIGPPYANRAQGILIRMLDDDNAGVQSAAAYALGMIGTPEAMTAINSHKRR